MKRFYTTKTLSGPDGKGKARLFAGDICRSSKEATGQILVPNRKAANRASGEFTAARKCQ
jgi:hypothetical protein